MLKDAGHGASDATLRRVATTLAAIAAAGSFAPDPPGALTADRDPPGFEALTIAPQPSDDRARRPRSADADSASERSGRDQKRLQEGLRAAETRERQQREAERARRKAERSQLQTALRAAIAELRTRERALAGLEKEVRAADKAVSDARETMQNLERQLAELGAAD